jgi:hypothetical protein
LLFLFDHGLSKQKSPPSLYLAAAKRQLKKSHLELNADLSLRSRLHDESEEGSWNPETDSVVSYQLLEQIEDSEEIELDDDYDITESKDDFDLEDTQDVSAKIMGKDNAVFQLAKFKYQQGQEYSKRHRNRQVKVQMDLKKEALIMKPLSYYFTPTHNNISGVSPVYGPPPPPDRQQQREEQATALGRIEKKSRQSKRAI